MGSIGMMQTPNYKHLDNSKGKQCAENPGHGLCRRDHGERRDEVFELDAVSLGRLMSAERTCILGDAGGGRSGRDRKELWREVKLT